MTERAFINPATLAQIDRTAAPLAEQWAGCYPRFIWEMCAAHALRRTSRLSVSKNGIRWVSGIDDNPFDAYESFYRGEHRAQMVGWVLWSLWHSAPETRAERFAAFRRCHREELAGLEWEDAPHTWGYRATYRGLASEEAAQQVAAMLGEGAGFKRATLRYSEVSGGWIVTVEATRRPCQPDDCQRCRILT